MSNKIKKENKKRNLRILEDQLNKYVDFYKENGTYYDNLYLNDVKCVIKTPFINSRKKVSNNDIRIEKFSLTNSIFIFNYE